MSPVHLDRLPNKGEMEKNCVLHKNKMGPYGQLGATFLQECSDITFGVTLAVRTPSKYTRRLNVVKCRQPTPKCFRGRKQDSYVKRTLGRSL